MLAKLAYKSSFMKVGETLDCFFADMALWNNHEELKFGCSKDSANKKPT